MRIVVVLAMLTLAACGADGEPVQPSASVNVGVGASGVHVGSRVGLRKGPISIGIAL
jgi:hypothetical protein